MNIARTDLVSSSRHRLQRTLGKSVEMTGIGFFTGMDVKLIMHPAEEHHGIVFQRTDLPGSPLVPANIEHTIKRERRTAVANGEAVIELTEHLLAAFYGMQVDNCLVQINAPELPGCDGSSRAFVDAIWTAGIVEQNAFRACWQVDRGFRVEGEDGNGDVVARPLSQRQLVLDYRLDYGLNSPIPTQSFQLEITPESFQNELSFARTFVLEQDVKVLRSQGYGQRVTEKDLLVFLPNGDVLGNQLRAPDECARHKMLDCLGDFALLGCDLYGQFNAFRSGHRLNREVVRVLKTHQYQSSGLMGRRRIA
ncbi:MAG: UDP-3-O-acyl-N-acetylglucosamine deacetylase [Planctomycetaceae bacterium]